MFHLGSQTKMGSAIVDLMQLLLSKKEQEKITVQEANLLMSWRAQSLRNSMIGFSGAATVSMLVYLREARSSKVERHSEVFQQFGHLVLVTPRKLNILARGSLSLGVSIFCALWSFGRSLESWTDRFLSLEGSRMQSELANIILKRYSDDPWVLRRLSKHFYVEEVYEDSSADKPKSRWHSRYFYGVPASHFHNKSDNEIKIDPSKNDVEKTTVESEKVYVNTAADASQDPFDFVFGFPGSEENIPPPKTSSPSSGRSSLREIRARRRHRRRHQEDSDV